MSLIEHAKYELEFGGLFNEENKYDYDIAKAVMELIEVFSKQGHSGYSANIVSNVFNKLSKFQTISPLTGNNDEWVEVTDKLFQNKRNSAVFKDGKDGKAYYIDAYIKKLQNGDYTSGRIYFDDIDGSYIGKCFIKNYDKMPQFVIDVTEDDIIKDEKQLDQLTKYYNYEILMK